MKVIEKYIKDENADWVVFLHGIGGNTNTFKKQVEDFSKHFNLLMFDYFGHGENKSSLPYYTFEILADEIIKMVDNEGINRFHTVSLSLGGIIANALLTNHAHRIKSMVQGGSILGYVFTSTFLLYLARIFKGKVPYMWLYIIYSFFLMPKKNHALSRHIFINEAKKLGGKEFIKWHNLFETVPSFYEKFFQSHNEVPKLYISGNEDHLFLSLVENLRLFDKYAKIVILENTGHVCNIESANEFNEEAIQFIKTYDYITTVRDLTKTIQLEIKKKPILEMF